jgi:hypothetical protein
MAMQESDITAVISGISLSDVLYIKIAGQYEHDDEYDRLNK